MLLSVLISGVLFVMAEQSILTCSDDVGNDIFKQVADKSNNWFYKSKNDCKKVIDYVGCSKTVSYVAKWYRVDTNGIPELYKNARVGDLCPAGCTECTGGELGVLGESFHKGSWNGDRVLSDRWINTNCKKYKFCSNFKNASKKLKYLEDHYRVAQYKCFLECAQDYQCTNFDYDQVSLDLGGVRGGDCLLYYGTCSGYVDQEQIPDLFTLSDESASCRVRDGAAKKQEPFCRFTTGDGKGGDEDKINNHMTGQVCAKECAKNPKYNGATIWSDGSGGCWCEYGMTYQNSKSSYKTCKLPGRTDTPDGYLKHTKSADNVFCDGTGAALSNYKVSSEWDCKGLCDKNAKCAYYSYWTTSGWCRTVTNCDKEATDGGHVIKVFKKTSGIESEAEADIGKSKADNEKFNTYGAAALFIALSGVVGYYVGSRGDGSKFAYEELNNDQKIELANYTQE